MRLLRKSLLALFTLATVWMAGCQTSTAPSDSAANATEDRRLAPARADIRGSIIMSRYNQGQVVLEVEGIQSERSRYTRAYVLVGPTTQIVDSKGTSISLSELREGQQVAILLRSGGQGNLVGMGVARKVWVEEAF